MEGFLRTSNARLRNAGLPLEFCSKNVTKVNRVAKALLAPVDSMQTFVTDSKADKKFIQALKKNGIEVIVA